MPIVFLSRAGLGERKGETVAARELSPSEGLTGPVKTDKARSEHVESGQSVTADTLVIIALRIEFSRLAQRSLSVNIGCFLRTAMQNADQKRSSRPMQGPQSGS
jgi:hypothetical protein